MPNAVLERLEEQRAEQVSFVDQMLGRADAEGRDLVPAERNNLDSARQRIAELDEQLKPLREFESLRADSGAANPTTRPPRPSEGRPLGDSGGFVYPSAGAYIVDLLRSKGVPWADRHSDRAPNAEASARIERAASQNQITTDTPGLLPTPSVGPVIGALDSSRRFVASLTGGARSMAGIPGATFNRPRITQHTQVGKQTAEKTQLPSRKMTIGSIPFAKETYGGVVDISRQDIDWTSPSAWDALVQDLANVYGWETDFVAANDLATSVTQSTTVESDDLSGWAAALYDAAMKAYLGGAAIGAMPGGALPDRVWLSVDMWAAFGAIVDPARMAAYANQQQALGPSEITNFAGEVLGAPRVVVPSLPAQTIIVGSSTMYEAYEEVVGLISAVEPSLFGVEVAYGGYFAYGTLEPNAFAKLVPPPPIGMTRARASSDEDDDTPSKRRR
jgi:hypothetical protein